MHCENASSGIIMLPGAGRQMDARKNRIAGSRGGSGMPAQIMATYNKDYSHKTATEWLSKRKWTGFLMSLPIRKKSKKFPVENASDAMSIRVTASGLNSNHDCDRRFEVKVDFDLKIVEITVTKK